MVHVADNSLYGYGYREINQQLAKDNGELRQALSLALHENSQQRMELHKKDLELTDLRRQVRELTVLREKFTTIKEIITNDNYHHHHHYGRPVESIVGESSQIKSLTLTAHNDDDENQDENQNGHEAPPQPTSTTQQSDQSNYLQPIEEEDSLQPADVTSVPPITHDDRSLVTPSIWNCLDTLAPEPGVDPESEPEPEQQPEPELEPEPEPEPGLESEPSPVKVSTPVRDNGHRLIDTDNTMNNNNLRAMFHSTPVQQQSAAAGFAAQQQARQSSRDSNEGAPEPPQPVRYNLRKRTKR